MDCPVLTELRLTEAYEPEHENRPHLSGGDYDISAIRSCADGCALDRRLHGYEVNDALQSARIEKLAAENKRLREKMAVIRGLARKRSYYGRNLGDLLKRIETAVDAALEGK